MNLQSIRIHTLRAALVLGCLGTNGYAQVSSTAQAVSATHVAAEISKGRLNPAQSKPGDQVTLKLKGDVRSNGEVILKKGAAITGVVKNVKRSEGKSAAKGQANSMMEIEWLAPVSQGRASQTLSIALQSVSQVHPLYAHEAARASDESVVAAPARAGSSPAGTAGGGGLVGGALASANSTVAAVGDIAAVPAAAAVSNTGRATGQTNAALLSMPTVVAADHQTSSAIESSLGSASSGQLFKTGRGELITSGGSKQSVDLYSHLNNDTVITSGDKNFEISSGAQMRLLIGVNKK